jgi:hypothetical protein
MKNLIEIIILNLIPLFIHCQITFEKTYGGAGNESAYSILQTDDNGYILCGETSSFGLGLSDIYVVKIDEYGNIEWTKTYGGPDQESGNCINKTNDGGFIICGVTAPFLSASSIAYLLKINSVGDTLWTRSYMGNSFSIASQVIQTDDNGYMICGSTQSGYLMESDVFIFKVNELGELIWSKTYGGDDYDRAISLAKTNDGGFIFCGATKSFVNINNGGNDIYIIKTDANGDSIWTKVYGGSFYDVGYTILRKEDDSYYVGGITSSTEHGKEYILLNLNSAGDTIWTKTFGDDDNNYCRNIALTNDNCIVGCGWSINFPSSDYKLDLFKCDIYGNLLWIKQYGGIIHDQGFASFQTNDNGFVIAGRTDSFGAGMNDMYLIKTDADGILTSMDESQEESDLINISPNPATSLITIQINEGIPLEEAIIYNHLGQKVLVKKPVNNTVDISKLKPGIYFIEVITSENRTRTKLVVE